MPLTKARKLTSGSKSTTSSTGSALVLLEPIQDPQLLNTRLVRRWKGIAPKLALTATAAKLILFSDPVHISEGPVFDQRDFKLVRVRRLKVAKRGTQFSYIYTIEVVNRGLDGTNPSERVTLFQPEPESQQVAPDLGGILEEDGICPSAKIATEIAIPAIKILNRVPLSLSNWDKPNLGSSLRRNVHLFTLQAWDNDLGISSLNPLYFPPVATRVGSYSMTINNNILDIPDGKNTTHLVKSGALNVVITDAAKILDNVTWSVVMQFSLKHVDVAKVQQDGIGTEGAVFGACNYTGNKTGDEGIGQACVDAAGALVDHVRKRMFGMKAPYKDLTALRDELMFPYLTKQNRPRGGPVNGQNAWKLHKSYGHNMTGNASVNSTPYTKQLIKVVNAEKGLKVPQFVVSSRSKISLAYTVKQMCESLRLSKGMINSWQNGILASVELALRRVQNDAIIDDILLDAQTNGNAYAVCMGKCFRPIVFTSLVMLDDGRLVCRTCASKSSQPDFAAETTFNLATAFRVSTRRSVYKENQHHVKVSEYHTMLKETLAVVDSFIIDKTLGVWLDGYGTERQISDGSWTGKYADIPLPVGRVSAVTSHPFQPSPEAPKRLHALAVVQEQTIIGYHGPKNIAMVPHYLNMAHFKYNISVVPLLREAAILKLDETIPASEHKARHANMVQGFHHAHFIGAKPPARLKTKLNSIPTTPTTIDALETEARSGIWDEVYVNGKQYFDVVGRVNRQGHSKRWILPGYQEVVQNKALRLEFLDPTPKR